MLDKKSKAGESNLPAKRIASILSGARCCRNRALGARRGGYLPALLVYNRWKAGDYLGRRGARADFPHVVPAALWAGWRLACRNRRGEGLLDGAWAWRRLCETSLWDPNAKQGRAAASGRWFGLIRHAAAPFWPILVWCLALGVRFALPPIILGPCGWIRLRRLDANGPIEFVARGDEMCRRMDRQQVRGLRRLHGEFRARHPLGATKDGSANRSRAEARR